MMAANVELLMGHDLGISKSYYKPQEKVILEDYLKAVKNLTINSNIDNEFFKTEIETLKAKNENNEKMLQSRLKEKDDALKRLSDQVMVLMQDFQNRKGNILN